MPNHVTSRCTVTGPADEVKRFSETCFVIDQDEKNGLIFDFDTVIPMPQILRDAPEDTYAQMGLEMILWRAENAPPFVDTTSLFSRQYAQIRADLDMKDARMPDVVSAFFAKNPDREQLGLNRLKAIAETGFASWYQWAPVNWGTKWSAYSFSVLSADPLLFKFDTAWNFPTPIFEKLTELFPTLTFDIVCFDEGHNFAGQGAFGVLGDLQSFEIVKANDDLYERVYGRKYELDVEEEDA